MEQDNRKRERVVETLNKKFGALSVFRMDERTDITQVKALPTGSLALDMAIGVGGFPRGRIVEIYGPEAAGKSLLLLSCIAQTQAYGGHCAFIDVEHALSPKFARLLGVNTTELYYSQPDSGEQALEIMETLISSSTFDIIGLDSVAALISEEEMEAGYDKQKIASTAIMMGKALKRMTAIISKTQTVAVFINQLRDKPMVLFGSPEYTPGGRALKFYSSLRIEVKKIDKERNEEGRQIAHTIQCNILKNKVAPPFSKCNIRLEYDRGIDKESDMVNIAIELGIITTASSWFMWRDKKWNGINMLREQMDWKLLLSDIQGVLNEQRSPQKEGSTKEEGSTAPSVL